MDWTAKKFENSPSNPYLCIMENVIKAKGHEDGILLEVNGQQVIISLTKYQQKYNPVRCIGDGWVECEKIK